MADTRLSGIGMTSLRTRERLVQRLQEKKIADARVLERIRQVPRHLFVDEALASRAYEDTALPIGFGQTISQPYVVALMTAALLEGGAIGNLLEIGTGCGYQTAVIAPLVGHVYTIERIVELVGRARRAMRDLRIRNVSFRHDDGAVGWPTKAPFDAILLTAAPAEVPAALFSQLSVGGRLLAPVGAEGQQQLVRYTKRENRLIQDSLSAVSFVPLVSGVKSKISR